MGTKHVVPRAEGQGGIGTATLGWGELFITNTTNDSATQGGKLTLTSNDGDAMQSGSRLGVIEFKGAESDSALTIGARIEAICDAAWTATENGASLKFYTTDANASESLVLTLDSNKLAVFSGAVAITGNLTVNGTTTTVNSTIVTIDDPVFTLGGDTAPISETTQDKGIEFRYHTGSAAKIGFFGWDDSASAFTFIPDATNNSEVFSGSAGDAIFGNLNLGGTLTLPSQTANRFFVAPNGSNGVPTFRVIAAADIPNDTIDSQHYAAGSIDNEHLAANSVNSDNYVDLSIDTAHIGNDQVTYAKIQNVSATNIILGRDSAGAGIIEEISPASLRTMINVADGANNYSLPFTDNSSNWNTAYGWGNHASAGYLTSHQSLSGYLPLSGGTLSGSLTGVSTATPVMSLQNTTASAYSEIHIKNNQNDQLTIGSIGSSYSNASWAGSRYIYSSSGQFRIKSANELKFYSGGLGDTGDLALFLDTNRNSMFMNAVLIGGYMGSNAYNAVASTTGLSFGGGNDFTNYSIGTTSENFGGNYTKLNIKWHTGIRFFAMTSYGGVRFYSDVGLTTKLFSIGEGDAHVRVSNNLYATGTVTGSNLSGTNTGDQTNISGNAATATTALTLDDGNNQWNWATGSHAYAANSLRLWDQYSSNGGSGNPTTYGSILHYSGRSGHMDSQLYFGESGQLLYRYNFYGNNNWNAWQTLITSSNYSSYALPLSGGALTGNLNVNYASGNYGSQVIAGQSAVELPYTLQDTNHRPVLAVTGKYPVIHLNHTVTSNANHGPTIQFTYNGHLGRQWLFGGGGTGEDLMISYSDTSLGNSNYNPHNGIAGYAGVSYIMCRNNGTIGIGSSGDWGAYGGGDPQYAIDTRGVLANDSYIRLTGSDGYLMGGSITTRSGSRAIDVGYASSSCFISASRTGSNPSMIMMGGSSNQNYIYNRQSGTNSTGRTMYCVVGTTSAFYVHGATGTVHFLNSTVGHSDRLSKKNIEDSGYGLEAINNLRPRRFFWKNEAIKEKQIGFIAQEVEEVLPEAVRGYEGDKGIVDNALLSVLTKAVQELSQQVTDLKAEVELLKQ